MSNIKGLTTRKVSYLFMSLLLLSLVTVLIVSHGNGAWNEPNITSGSKAQANVNIAIRGISIIIRNDNNFDWANTEVTLSHGLRMYHLQAGKIAKGETKGFILSNFVSSDGEPFNYNSYKPEAVILSSDEAEGTVPKPLHSFYASSGCIDAFFTASRGRIWLNRQEGVAKYV